MRNRTVRTTLALPAELLEATGRAVREGKAHSRNEIVARALSRELAAQKRAEIDRALAEMASDPEYQAEVLRIEAEFADAQWQAFQLAESQEEQDKGNFTMLAWSQLRVLSRVGPDP